MRPGQVPVHDPLGTDGQWGAVHRGPQVLHGGSHGDVPVGVLLLDVRPPSLRGQHPRPVPGASPQTAPAPRGPAVRDQQVLIWGFFEICKKKLNF